MSTMSSNKAVGLGFSTDKRRRRREHRLAARYLREQARGSSTLLGVAAWHLQQARWAAR